MKSSTLLKKAKKHLSSTIKDRKSLFICLAVRLAALNSKDKSALRTAVKLYDHISAALCGRGDLRTWLIWQGVPEKELTFRRVQAHRHEWLNQLIHEFKQAGD